MIWENIKRGQKIERSGERARDEVRHQVKAMENSAWEWLMGEFATKDIPADRVKIMINLYENGCYGEKSEYDRGPWLRFSSEERESWFMTTMEEFYRRMNEASDIEDAAAESAMDAMRD